MNWLEAADRTSQEYENAPQELKGAFEESILDGKEVKTATQDVIDSRTEFLLNRYNRLGFGETDKTALKHSSLRVKKHWVVNTQMTLSIS